MHLLVSFLVVVILDQYTKYLVVANLTLHETIELVPGFFNLILTYNKGAAFGLLADLPDTIRYIALTVTTLIALSAVVYFLLRDYREDFIAQIALSFIVGGAVGNILDRVRLGMVVDFLDVYYNNYHWPAFNVADSAICLGVAVLLFRKPHKVQETELA